jgi:hypothetical protein
LSSVLDSFPATFYPIWFENSLALDRLGSISLSQFLSSLSLSFVFRFLFLIIFSLGFLSRSDQLGLQMKARYGFCSAEVMEQKEFVTQFDEFFAKLESDFEVTIDRQARAFLFDISIALGRRLFVHVVRAAVSKHLSTSTTSSSSSSRSSASFATELTFDVPELAAGYLPKSVLQSLGTIFADLKMGATDKVTVRLLPDTTWTAFMPSLETLLPTELLNLADLQKFTLAASAKKDLFLYSALLGHFFISEMCELSNNYLRDCGRDEDAATVNELLQVLSNDEDFFKLAPFRQTPSAALALSQSEETPRPFDSILLKK